MNFQQTLNEVSQMSNLALVPSTFEELSTLALTGKSTNDRLSAAASLPPETATPESAYLFGGNRLSTAGSMAVTFDKSSRSMFRFGLTGNQTKMLGDQLSFFYTDRPLDPQLRRSTNIALTSGWTYMLDPRTTLTTDLNASRIMSEYQDAYLTRTSVGLGRKMSERWFLRGSTGIGWVRPARSVFLQQPFSRHEWSASVGYKVYAHTLMGTYSSMASDQFGMGANRTITSRGVWSWQRPGRGVSLSSSFGYSQMLGPSFPNAGAWNGLFSFSKSLTSHTSMMVSYRALQFPRSVLFYSPSNTVHGLTTSFTWTPAPQR